MSLRKYKTSKSNKVTWKYQKGGLVQYGNGGLNWSGIENSANIKGGLGIAGMAGGALQAVGGQDSYAAQGLGGVASGAAAGMMLGPLGAIVGGAIGGGIGLLKAGAANKQQDAEERAQMEQRQGMIRMQQQSDATENPYAATFAYGGRVPGYDPMVGFIPEVGVYGKRPVKPIVPSNPSMYTPQGGGNWSYNGGADQWVNSVNRDKKGKPMIMSPEDYVKKGGPGYKQLIQANYRELYGKGGQVPPKIKYPNKGTEKIIQDIQKFNTPEVFDRFLKVYTKAGSPKINASKNNITNLLWTNRTGRASFNPLMNKINIPSYDDFDLNEEKKKLIDGTTIMRDENLRLSKEWNDGRQRQYTDSTEYNNEIKRINNSTLKDINPNVTSDVIAELTHALQRNNKDYRPSIGSVLKSKGQQLSFGLFGDQYETPGTMEYNAHSVIEPDIDHYIYKHINEKQQGVGKGNIPYSQGGMIPQGMPNAELEKQEVTQGPDGSMQKMNMPSHANATGKNQVALEPGTIIYTDELRPVKESAIYKEYGNITYAQIADKLRKQLEKYEQQLQA